MNLIFLRLFKTISSLLDFCNILIYSYIIYSNILLTRNLVVCFGMFCTPRKSRESHYPAIPIVRVPCPSITIAAMPPPLLSLLCVLHHLTYVFFHPFPITNHTPPPLRDLQSISRASLPPSHNLCISLLLLCCTFSIT